MAGGGRELFAERLQPFLQGRSGGKLHVTGLQPNGAAYKVQGYIEGSTLGELRLPDDLHMVKKNGAWKWQGIVDSMQARMKSIPNLGSNYKLSKSIIIRDKYKPSPIG